MNVASIINHFRTQECKQRTELLNKKESDEKEQERILFMSKYEDMLTKCQGETFMERSKDEPVDYDNYGNCGLPNTTQNRPICFMSRKEYAVYCALHPLENRRDETTQLCGKVYSEYLHDKNPYMKN